MSLETVKKVKNAILYKDSSGQLLIRLDNVRLSFPFLGTPAEDENDDGTKVKKWRCVAMLPKKTHTAAKDLCKEVIQQLIKDNDAKVPTSGFCRTVTTRKARKWPVIGWFPRLTARFARVPVTARGRSSTTSTRSMKRSTVAAGQAC